MSEAQSHPPDAQPKLSPAETPIPDYPRLRLHRAFHSQFLPSDRDVIVHLPEAYDADPERHFPVLFLQDGQNLFDGRTSFIPGLTWGVQGTADAAIADHQVEPLVIVGIYNTGLQRVEEYTPTRDPRIKAGGKAPIYARMLIEELLPSIRSEYRIASGPANTGVGGSSLGGLLSLYLGLAHPEVFGAAAALSPSVWWDNRSILAAVNQASPRPDLRVWLDMGTAEGRRGLRDADLLHQLLLQRGWKEGIDLAYLRVPGATHNEAAWAERVGPMLKFLFPAR